MGPPPIAPAASFLHVERTLNLTCKCTTSSQSCCKGGALLQEKSAAAWLPSMTRCANATTISYYLSSQISIDLLMNLHHGQDFGFGTSLSWSSSLSPFLLPELTWFVQSTCTPLCYFRTETVFLEELHTATRIIFCGLSLNSSIIVSLSLTHIAAVLKLSLLTCYIENNSWQDPNVLPKIEKVRKKSFISALKGFPLTARRYNAWRNDTVAGWGIRVWIMGQYCLGLVHYFKSFLKQSCPFHLNAAVLFLDFFANPSI